MIQDPTRLEKLPETDQREEQILSREVKTVLDLGQKCSYHDGFHVMDFYKSLSAAVEYKLKQSPLSWPLDQALKEETSW